MIRGIDCQIRRANCQMAAAFPESYSYLWVKKGYASGSIVAKRFEYIFLGAYHIKSLSTGLINSEIGGNSTDSRAITLGADDKEVDVTKRHRTEWFQQNVIYYFSQPKFMAESHQDFLDFDAEARGIRYRLLEIVDKKIITLKLILREHQERKLKSGGNIFGQTES